MIKKILKFIIQAIASLIGLFIIVFIMMGGCSSISQLRHFNQLVESGDHQEILLSAIGVVEEATDSVTYSDSANSELKIELLPVILQKMKPGYVWVSTNRMRIELHGGHDHFGFEIEKNDSWNLSWYTEGNHGLLATELINDEPEH